MFFLRTKGGLGMFVKYCGFGKRMNCDFNYGNVWTLFFCVHVSFFQVGLQWNHSKTYQIGIFRDVGMLFVLLAPGYLMVHVGFGQGFGHFGDKKSSWDQQLVGLDMTGDEDNANMYNRKKILRFMSCHHFTYECSWVSGGFDLSDNTCHMCVRWIFTNVYYLNAMGKWV